MMSRGYAGNAVNAGAAKGVAFSRAVTAADTAFASTSVALPRSSKPLYLNLSVSAGAALVQVQGNGVEYYSTTVTVNQPTNLPLTGFPETTSVSVQSEILAAATLAGTLYYT
jgi:hypothetical protein